MPMCKCKAKKCQLCNNCSRCECDHDGLSTTLKLSRKRGGQHLDINNNGLPEVTQVAHRLGNRYVTGIFYSMVFAGDVRKKVSCNSHVLHSMYNMSVTIIQNMVSIDSVTNMISISVTDMLEIDCNTWMLQLI